MVHYEKPFRTRLREIKKLIRKEGKVTSFMVSNKLNISRQQARQILEEGVRRGKLRAKKVYYDGKPPAVFYV